MNEDENVTFELIFDKNKIMTMMPYVLKRERGRDREKEQ